MPDVAQLPTWKNKLARRKNGEPYPDERNVRIALELCPELRGLLRYNEFSDHVELTRPPPGLPREADDAMFQDDEPQPLGDDHLTALTIYLAEQGFVSLRQRTVHDTVVLMSRFATVNPVRAFLEECANEWDQKPRIDQWLSTYLRARDNADYLKDVGSKFLIGAVARVYEPGCQMDSMLSLEGEQGVGKSTVVRILGREWSADLYGDVGDKDAAIGIQRVWIAELAELSALRRSDQESMKGFISRRVDHYRPPYGRNTVARPRHTVFVATTNDDDYLQDPTGARRFWPVECGEIDLEALKRDAVQLLGEAVERYLEKEPWHLDSLQTLNAKQQQAARQRMSPAEELVLEYADRMVESGRLRIEMRQLLRDVFEISSAEDPGKAGAMGTVVSRALIREGWKRLKPVGRGKNRVQAYELRSQGSQAESNKNGYEHGSEISTHKAHKQEMLEQSDDIPF